MRRRSQPKRKIGPLVKNQPVRRRKARRKPGAFRPWRFSCISFFAAQRDAFWRRDKMTLMRLAPQVETAFACGEIASLTFRSSHLD